MKNLIKKIQKNQGQSLITLIIFMVMSTIIITAAVAIIITNSKSTGKFYQGERSLKTAEAGIENALIRLLRDPDYSGETLNIDTTTAEIQVADNGNDTYTIVSSGQSGDFLRTITVDVSYTNNVMDITSWHEE